jgi:hypothetical protein
MTNDSSYPAEWLVDSVHPMDPRLSDVLDDYQPTDAQRAAVAELWNSYASRSTAFPFLYMGFAADTYANFAWIPMFLALLEQATQRVIGAEGEPLALARLRADMLAALDDAEGKP